VTGDEPRLLLLIRHGRSDLDSDDMTVTARGRQWDPPLGEEGRLQAELLGRRLAMMPPPAAVYCSTFRRARETIAPYVSRTACEVTYLEDLGEAFIGAWEGMSFEEIVKDDEEMLSLFRNQEAMWRRAPGAEPLPRLQERATAAIETALTLHPRGSVVVVAHGGIINAYIAPILGLHDLEMFFLPDNTSINTVVVEGDRRSVRFLSDVRHLHEPHFFDPDA
jgi:2,3-bisphosphoglycerate-dependent phosphoglycerate mutase